MSNQKKTVSILGVTGTIGTNTIDLISQHQDKFQVKTIIAKENIERLSEFARKVNAENVVINNQEKYSDLKQLLSGTDIKVFSGEDDRNSLCGEKVDIFISGAVGFCALEPTMQAIKAGSRIGLANKECLVCAGNIMMDEVEKNKTEIIPIDSEHHSIFEVFEKNQQKHIEKIILTASGGPFRDLDFDKFANITPEMAVAHPNWDMGAKISVDSATMMNKGLEVIEAYYLFPINKKQIDVLVHPQSIIHGMVCYDDGSVLAGLSSPDMRTPISYALNYPERLENNTERLDFTKIKSLEFREVDRSKYKCLELAINALNDSERSIIALNAANEIAVSSFLNEDISFLDIAKYNEITIDKIQNVSSLPTQPNNLGDIIEIDKIARDIALESISCKRKVNVA
jgi:1-deoxy-D-xylulose-5-phosphate reductoisomerase